MMDEVIQCYKCKNDTFVIGTAGTRCGKCGEFISYDSKIYEAALKDEGD